MHWTSFRALGTPRTLYELAVERVGTLDVDALSLLPVDAGVLGFGRPTTRPCRR
jgi:hypothetical protein